jgi:hypothetical protein
MLTLNRLGQTDAMGSITIDAFSTRADQCPLLFQYRHYYCSAQRSDAKGQAQMRRIDTLNAVEEKASFSILSVEVHWMKNVSFGL